MHVLTKEEFLSKQREHAKQILQGAIFIHPTDTIYGIGTSALDSLAVKKIRMIKRAPTMPFSVIAPSKRWIFANCEVRPYEEEWISKMPGPYTLILKLKNRKAVSEEVNLATPMISVRIPDHWIATIASELNIPLVTTSVNLSGNVPMKHLGELQPEIAKFITFCIDEGLLMGRASKVIDCTAGACVVHEPELTP